MHKKLIIIALVATAALFPALGQAEDFTPLSPSEDEAENRVIWVGYDHNETLEGIPVPSLDFRLKVVAIYPFELGDMETTFIDCFVKVAEVPWLQDEIIPIDEYGWPFVEDLDGVLRPMHGIEVDTTRCTSPSGAAGEP